MTTYVRQYDPYITAFKNGKNVQNCSFIWLSLPVMYNQLRIDSKFNAFWTAW